MKDNCVELQPVLYGEDVPDELCYQWAEDYFRDLDAEEDKEQEEKFVPRQFQRKQPVSSRKRIRKSRIKTGAEETGGFGRRRCCRAANAGFCRGGESRMRLNKRACRKLADPTWKMNLNSGLFCADQLQYIVRSAVRNVDHQRVLILYVYDREQVNVGETRPLWTVFQSREQYITLARREDGAVYWRKAAFDNLSRQPSFRNKCAFYSLNDEKKVMRFCKEDKKTDLLCLDSPAVQNYASIYAAEKAQ